MAYYFCCCLLLQLFFGVVLSGTEKILAFSGMSIPLVSNLTFNGHIILHRNGKKNYEQVAVWNVMNATITPMHVNPDYRGKIFMDMEKTLFIWICDVDRTHSAKYFVRYGFNTAEIVSEVELTIMENKQLNKCWNSPPNSPEKCFGNLAEEQIVQYIEKFLDNNTQYIKKHFGSCDSSIKELLIALLVIVSLAITLAIIVLIYKKCCSESKSQKYAAVPNKGPGVRFRKFTETIHVETAERNETGIGQTIPQLPQTSSQTIPKLPQPSKTVKKEEDMAQNNEIMTAPLPTPILPTGKAVM